MVLYSLLFIAGLFLCVTLVSILEASNFIKVRTPSGYILIAVMLEIAITLLIVDL